LTYEKNNEAVAFLTREAAALLERHGEDTDTARRGADAFMERLRLIIGGIRFYIPAGLYTRKYDIRKEFDTTGESIEDLAKRHNLSMVRIHKIIKITAGKTAPTKQKGDIQAIVIEVARMLITHGVSPEDAAQAAGGFISIFIANFGRQYVYIPKGLSAKVAKRNKQIISQYRAGTAISTIAKNFGATSVWVGEIIKAHGEISPRQKRSAMTISRLKKSILNAAPPYRRGQPNEEVHSLLMTAAEAVEQARAIAAGNNPPKRSEPQ
jgi:Mor family transcriptional regulator